MKKLSITKKGGQKIAVITAVCAFGIAVSLATSNAAPKTMSDGGTFDAEYYAQNNPDVVAALGSDESTLYQHYLNYGKAEGRAPYQQAVKLTDDEIRAKAYAMQAMYPDGMYWGKNRCGEFALIMKRGVFGDQNNGINMIPPEQVGLPSGTVKIVSPYCVIKPLSFDDIVVGARVAYSGTQTPSHEVFVLDKNSSYITVCEGSSNAQIRWGRKIYRKGCAPSSSYEEITDIVHISTGQ